MGTPVDHDLLATAMAYGTAVASFNVEEFGTERVVRLTPEEVQTRVCELHRMTQFTHPDRGEEPRMSSAFRPRDPSSPTTTAKRWR